MKVIMILVEVVHSTARIMFTFMSLSAVQNMIHLIYFNSCHIHHRAYYKRTMACSPVGLISSMNRALRLVIAKVRVPFPNAKFFSFFFKFFQVVHSNARIMFTFMESLSFVNKSFVMRL